MGLIISSFLLLREGEEMFITHQKKNNIINEGVCSDYFFKWTNDESWCLEYKNLKISSYEVREIKEKNGKLILLKNENSDKIIIESF